MVPRDSDWLFRAMNQNTSLTFTGRLRSVWCAARGIGVMLRSQRNAWIHALATVTVCVIGFLFGLSRSDWCWIVLAVMAVWTAEALNTALEFLTDFPPDSRQGQGCGGWSSAFRGYRFSRDWIVSF